ncbi:hypothetical protein Adeg_0729 [Ammonifex degensii KC4]|uniref:TrbC/VirB2 family protein n=1 Tax=Ammonifex degensii (strain DSM 10501 / KC4) TaxID=429009 RepID=C9RC98_AMMDK|nr:hypothetical protein [Ammonifex degensii]ACX51875.1 hypothetical protein Adeg_0729 [Ammonifex degensii KC4]
MRLFACLLLAVFFASCLVFPLVALAADAQGPAGIQPIPPSEAVNRVDTLMGKGYLALGSVVDRLALLVFGAAAVCALAAFFTGWAFFKKVLGMLALVALGLLVFYLAPFLVGVTKGIAVHFS